MRWGWFASIPPGVVSRGEVAGLSAGLGCHTPPIDAHRSVPLAGRASVGVAFPGVSQEQWICPSGCASDPARVSGGDR